jgi:hypothetical protein
VTTIAPTVGGGWTVQLNGNATGVLAGDVTGDNVAFFPISGGNTPASNVTTSINSIGSIGICDFTR